MILLSVDPGLAATGFAVFTTSAPAGPLAGFVDAWEYSTSADDHIAHRLLGIYRATRNAVRDTGAGLVVIETPATGGDYGGQSVRRGSVNLLYQALGVVQAGAAHELLETNEPADLEELVHYIRPGRGKKNERHAQLREMARAAGVKLPGGPRGGILANAWDATHNAARWLVKQQSR